VLRAASTLAVIASSVALGACGGSSGPSSSSGANGSAGASNKGSSQEASRLKFEQCLREHGVPVSDSGEKVPALQNTPPATLKAAFAACQKYAAGSFGQAASPSGQTHLIDQLVKYASCMRENGVNVADPTEGGIGGAASFANKLGQVRQDPNFPQANSKCQKNLPSESERGG
jgi:hypothetical protein